MNDPDRTLLELSLAVAVPLHIDELQRRPWDVVEAFAHEAGQIVAEKGDVIQFKGKKKGETAAAFNSLARGIACLAFCPGGVKVFGGHWEAEHPDKVK